MARRARHAPGVLRAAAVGLLAGLVGAGLARAERAPTTTATPMGLVIPLYFHRDYSEWARVAEAAARIPVVAVVSDNYNTPGREVDPKLAAGAVKIELMHQYSWGSRNQQYRWVCSRCSAEWGLFPTFEGHPTGAVEVAIHFGSQLSQTAAHTCPECNVIWQ